MTHKELENIIPSLRPHLIRVGYDFFADMAKAEDVAQEVLMRLWLTADRIDPDIGITPLAVRMAKNYCVSEWRKQKHKPPVIQPEALAAKPDNSADAMERMIETEERERLKNAIGNLTATEQRLIKMRYDEEMDIGQITEATGITPRSASSMLSMARKKLQTIWRKEKKYE